MNLSQLKESINKRRIYLWGARQLGFSTLRVLRRESFQPEAFLDSSPDLQGESVLGLDVLNPINVLNDSRGKNYIIITSGFYAPEIKQLCLDAGLTENLDFIAAEKLQRFDYQIDVSGSCNLRCISCPRGNFSHSQRPAL